MTTVLAAAAPGVGREQRNCELDIHEKVIQIARAIESAGEISASIEEKKLRAQEQKRTQVERFAAVLQERVDAAHAALNGQLRRVSDWTSRATDLSDELSRALRGTRSWPTAQEWSALQSRVALLLSAQPTRAEAEGLEFDIQAPSPARAPPSLRPAARDEPSPAAELSRLLHEERAKSGALAAELESVRRTAEERNRACRALESSAATLRYQFQAVLARLQAAEASTGTVDVNGTGHGGPPEMEALERNLERILGDPGHGGALGDPMRLLRDVCEGGGKEGAREREGGGAWEQGLKEEFRKAVLAMKARYERERDILRSQIREMEKRHRDELRVAGALPEELAATERAEVLEKENRRLREALAESRDGAETEAQYRLYKQRVEQEKELRELRERYNRDMTAAKSEIASLARELRAFRDGDWAKEALREEAAVKDAQLRAALVEAQARHEQELEGLADQAAGAIMERDVLQHELLADLRQSWPRGEVGQAGGAFDESTVTPYHTMGDALRLVEAAQRAQEEARGGRGAGAGDEAGAERGERGEGRVGYITGHTVSHASRQPTAAAPDMALVGRAVSDQDAAVLAAVRWANSLEQGAGRGGQERRAPEEADRRARGDVWEGGVRGSGGVAGTSEGHTTVTVTAGGGAPGDRTGRAASGEVSGGSGADGVGGDGADWSAWSGATADRIRDILRRNFDDPSAEDSSRAGQTGAGAALRNMATEAEKRQALACASRQAPKEPSQKPPRPPRSDREATARRVDFVLGRRPEGVTEGADEGDAGGRLGGAGVLPRDPFAKGRPAEGGLVCARCGKNDTSSPGECRFHPALVRGPAPFMYGVEWQACKAAGHTHRDAGCYARSEHFYPVGLLSVASRGLPDSGEDCNDVDDDGPRPASAAPRPWGRSQ